MKLYKDIRKTEFQVGLFVIIGLLILILSYSWLVELFTTRNYTNLRVAFPAAGNIEPGSAVTVLGVKVGRVSKISVVEQTVEMELLVKLDFPLKADSEFLINEVDLMGETRVEIIPGSSDVMLDTSRLQTGSRNYGMGTLISELSKVVLELQEVMAMFREEGSLLHGTREFVDNSISFVQKLHASYDNNAGQFDEFMLKSNQVVSRIDLLLSNNEAELDSAIQAINDGLQEFRLTLIELRDTAVSVKQFSEKLNSGEGSLNQLINDKELYEKLTHSAARLDSLLLDIKDNPKRYFKFQIF